MRANRNYTEKVNMCMGPDLLAQILTRGDVSSQIREGLLRYYQMLAGGRQRLREREVFGEADLVRLANTLSRFMVEARMLPSLVDDLAAAGLEEEVVRRLRTLTIDEIAALVDAVERYLRAVGTGMVVDAARMLE